MQITVSAATADDLDVLVRLNQVVQAVHAALYPDDFKPACHPPAVRAFLASRLARPGTAICLAEHDGSPVGYLMWEVQPRPESVFNPARPRAYVHHVVVLPTARRRGVAAALMRHVEQDALSRDIGEIALDYWAANAEAADFFRSQGFAPYNVSVRKTLRAGA